MAAPTEGDFLSDRGVSKADKAVDHKQAEDDAVARPPWRRDPNGVSHVGADGVLRSLNADRTAVLDYRRLSPEEVKKFAAPFDQATRDALEGVDGRDVTDEAQLWAVPKAKAKPEGSSADKPIK